jgi:hypothetical protein
MSELTELAEKYARQLACHAGTGTRSLFRSLRWKSAARIASEFGTAFCDGAWVATQSDAKVDLHASNMYTPPVSQQNPKLRS